MLRTCTIDGCDNPHEARGWCKNHYYRWNRYGDPLGTPSRGARRGSVRVPLSDVDANKRAAAWAGQLRFDTEIVKLCDDPVHVR